jgi:APA family basic amino acid/polyamine antiporter
LIVLGLYVGLQTDVLSNNFANMWEASKTVVNPDGTVTVTKLAGMAILGAAGRLSTRYFLVMHGIT